jgi:hypothetical protein
LKNTKVSGDDILQPLYNPVLLVESDALCLYPHNNQIEDEDIRLRL